MTFRYSTPTRSPLSAEMLTMALRDAGMNVQVEGTGGGCEALRITAHSQRLPCVLLTDGNACLPGTDPRLPDVVGTFATTEEQDEDAVIIDMVNVVYIDVHAIVRTCTKYLHP